MRPFIEKTKANLYGIQGKQNVYSWHGLSAHFKNSGRVDRCERYETCTSDKKSSSCVFSIKRFDAISILESEFNVTQNIAEKLIDTLIDMGWARALRCYRESGDVGGFDEGTRIITFDE
jgi:hypothetical protein